MSLADNGIEEFLESLVRFFITGNNTAGLDMWMAWIVHTCLDAVSEGHTSWSSFVLQIVVHFWVFLQKVGHEIGVFADVWHLVGSITILTTESCVFLWAVEWSITESTLDPCWKCSGTFSSVVSTLSFSYVSAHLGHDGASSNSG